MRVQIPKITAAQYKSQEIFRENGTDKSVSEGLNSLANVTVRAIIAVDRVITCVVVSYARSNPFVSI
jgi:hypothetical protein